MIFALGRLIVLVFLLSTVVYIVMSLYSRSVRKGKLEREFDEEIKTGDRDAFIEKGLEEYSQSLRRQLILLVYVVPLIVIFVIFYLVNFA